MRPCAIARVAWAFHMPWGGGRMKARYQQTMEQLYLGCIVISAAALVVITLVVPFGVFARYVLQSPKSWPEPMAILLMIVFTFIGGAGVYRAQVHIRINAILDAVPSRIKARMLFVADLLMVLICLFMVGYGSVLVRATWHQSIAEFPGLSVGLTYLPIPVSGFLTLLFVVEYLWIGAPPATSIIHKDQPRSE
jgi:TRAP-type C4-dicarboxylate transport system permease small subunit